MANLFVSIVILVIMPVFTTMMCCVVLWEYEDSVHFKRRHGEEI